MVKAHFVIASSKYRTSKQTYKGAEGETPVVDRVALCSDRRNNLCVKFMIRHTRRPEVRVCGFMLYSTSNFQDHFHL